MKMDGENGGDAVEMRKRLLIRSAAKARQRLANSNRNQATPTGSGIAGTTPNDPTGTIFQKMILDITRCHRMYWALLAALVLLTSTTHLTLHSLRISVDALVRESLTPATIPLEVSSIRQIIQDSVQEEIQKQSGRP